jgi:hypothetical protein
MEKITQLGGNQMISMLYKEEIVLVKLKVLGILNKVTEDELYTKEMLITDLTNLVEKLDLMDERIED